MDEYKKIMVCLDLTEVDEYLLQYLAYWGNIVPGTREVVLFHNIKHAFPEEMEDLMTKLEKPLRSYIQEAIEEGVKKYLPEFEPEIKIEISEEDSTAHAIAESARKNKTDLVILGKKIQYRGSGIVPSKLLRLSESSLLFVPETAFHSMRSILVPVDFSGSSMDALKTGIHLKVAADAKIQCQHVYHIPARYFPYVRMNNLDRDMVEQAQRRFEKFVKKAGWKGEEKISCAYTNESDRSIPQSIYSFATRNKCDLIVIGHRGQTMFVGSVAIGLANLDMHIPLMIVKK